MLSYRHSFHAGNHADVLKHVVQIEILKHLAKKDKAFDYIDTHAGAGVYRLDSAHAQKNPEYLDGVARVMHLNWPELASYQEVVRIFNDSDSEHLQDYPGSPIITEHFLRQGDKSWLFELHPSDFDLLDAAFEGERHAKVQNSDGLAGLKAVLPPKSKRALVLIDPSYEIKDDYDAVVNALKAAHKKFPTGTYAIWYPVVDRQRIGRMERFLMKSGIRSIQQFELSVEHDSEGYGMTGSGMIVVNPPWTLMATMQALLPKLASVLSQDESLRSEPLYRCHELVAE